MKKLITFFVNIWVFLFGKKVKETEHITKPKKIITPTSSDSKTPAHNNRKNTKGRHIQVDKATGRTIYHGAK